jgi:Protein of unknown function (DUF2975)
LIAIIDTVKVGSPFIIENAKRLREMGWLVLASEALALLGMPLSVWLEQSLGEGDYKFTLSFDAIITALLLFILARVFQQGAQMRDELEGTV